MIRRRLCRGGAGRARTCVPLAHHCHALDGGALWCQTRHHTVGPPTRLLCRSTAAGLRVARDRRRRPPPPHQARPQRHLHRREGEQGDCVGPESHRADPMGGVGVLPRARAGGQEYDEEAMPACRPHAPRRPASRPVQATKLRPPDPPPRGEPLRGGVGPPSNPPERARLQPLRSARPCNSSCGPVARRASRLASVTSWKSALRA